jgi:hypothetical protein
MKIQNFINSIISILITSVFFLSINSCTKDNITEAEKTDSILGRKIRYTVMVYNASENVKKSSVIMDSVLVSLVMNDSIYKEYTDSNGIVSFNNIAAGYVAVSVTSPHFTDVNYIANLTLKADTNLYDNTNLRNASSLIAIFSLNSEFMATISGYLYIPKNEEINEYEKLLTPVKIRANICDSNIYKYSQHTGSGGIEQMVYNNFYSQTISDNNGYYSLKLPTNLSGIKLCIEADDFKYANQTTEKIYTQAIETLIIKAGGNYYRNIYYNGFYENKQFNINQLSN